MHLVWAIYTDHLFGFSQANNIPQVAALKWCSHKPWKSTWPNLPLHKKLYIEKFKISWTSLTTRKRQKRDSRSDWELDINQSSVKLFLIKAFVVNYRIVPRISHTFFDHFSPRNPGCGLYAGAAYTRGLRTKLVRLHIASYSYGYLSSSFKQHLKSYFS